VKIPKFTLRGFKRAHEAVLGGGVNFISHAPVYGGADGERHGRSSVFYSSPTNGFGGNTLLTYGARRYGLLMNLNARRINRLRPGQGLDTHAAVTRFLGTPSDVLGERLPDTAFTQYGGLLRANFNLDDTTQLLFSYARNQQDGGRRYDQLAGGDGNLIADLRNLMTDLFYVRLVEQNPGFFDNAQFTFSYNGQREERVNQGGQGNPLAAITNQRERTNVFGFNFYVDKRLGEQNTLTLGSDIYRDKIAAPAFTTPGASGSGSAGGTLISTGETLAQVQNRLLPIGATINGITVINNDTSVPLYPELPGYGLVGLRGAFSFGERSEVFIDFENIADKQYRGISWGIDGAGRGVTVRYRYKF
jgi:hemoglobin/transferrin/lactoferrin receptor protein